MVRLTIRSVAIGICTLLVLVAHAEPARSQEAPNRDPHGPADVQSLIESLLSDDRVAELQPERVITSLMLSEDAIVADLGSGPGVFTVPLAKELSRGVVYAVDVEPQQLDALRQRLIEADLHNVVPVLASFSTPHLPPAALDLILLVDTYHHIEQRIEYFRQLRSVLRPGGRIAIIEYKSGELPVGPGGGYEATGRTAREGTPDGGLQSTERARNARILRFRALGTEYQLLTPRPNETMTEAPSSSEKLSKATLEPLVSVRSRIPEDAMSAGLLGTERSGHGIRIREDGLIVTIGYVVTEADEIWIGSHEGSASAGVVIGHDFQSGLALIKPTTPLPGPVMALGKSCDIGVGDAVTVVASAGVEPQDIDAQVVSRQEFAGRWEYLIDGAIFTAPPHQNWSGAALINLDGQLVGVGSLVIQGFEVNGSLRNVNMFVPIDLLVPVIDEICAHGRRLTPPRPWLGVLVHDEDGELTIVGTYRDCPADDAGLRPGDTVLQVDDQPIHNLGHLFRSIWSLGDAGVEVPLTILRNSKRQKIVVKSSDRTAFLRKGTVQ